MSKIGHIFTYTATDPEIPAAYRWVAGHVPEGASFPNWFCSGESPQAARDKMAAFLSPPKKIQDVKNAVMVPGDLESPVVEDYDEVL